MQRSVLRTPERWTRGSVSRSNKRPRVAACAALALIALVADAKPSRAESGFAGTYEPSPQRMEVKVTTWGEDCGTRPQDQTINETGKVTVTDEGAHLSLRFGSRSLRTNGCWSENPSLTLVSATSTSGSYRSECRTAAGDPKRELGRYSVSATPGKLELLEESEYNWQLKASHCVAKVRVTQTLTAVGLKPVPAVVDAGAAPAPAAAPCIAGPAARLRMRPSEARIAPGERVCFVVKAIDSAGCELSDAPIELSLQRPSGVQGNLSGSCFKAAENTALAEGLFKVEAASGALRAEANVMVAAPDLSDITARRSGSGATTLGSGNRGAESQYEAGVRAVAKGARDMLWLGIGLAAFAGVLALGAILALRAARKPAAGERTSMRPSRPERQRSERAPATEPVAKRVVAAAPPPAAATTGGPQRICPKCRRGYPPGSERCAADGEQLVDYAAFAAASASKSKASFCPECGEALSQEALFCGACGHKLTMR